MADVPTWPPDLGPVEHRDAYQHPVLARARVHKESLWSLLHMFRDAGELIIPEYQRARVWTPRQQAAFLGYAFEGGPLPTVFIREVDTEAGICDELVDGQQRLTAFVDWTEGKVPAVLPTRGRSLWVRDMPQRRVDFVMSIPVGRFRGTLAEALDLYLAINCGGTPHTDAELDRVRAMRAELD